MRKNVKHEIMQSTIELIREKGSNPAEITIREICNRIGIGAGLVNYHFQTKENLIAQCVQEMISEVIKQAGDVYKTLPEMTPVEKLRWMVKYTCEFLVTHENIARISILADLTAVNQNDNTSQTIAAFSPLVRRAFSNQAEDQEIKQRTYLMILTLQSLFLRSASLKIETGIDFNNRQQRENLIDQIIDCYLN